MKRYPSLSITMIDMAQDIGGTIELRLQLTEQHFGHYDWYESGLFRVDRPNYCLAFSPEVDQRR